MSLGLEGLESRDISISIPACYDPEANTVTIYFYPGSPVALMPGESTSRELTYGVRGIFAHETPRGILKELIGIEILDASNNPFLKAQIERATSSSEERPT